MSAVGIGLAWAFIAFAAFVALSSSALAGTRHELEVEPRGSNARGPRASAHWPVIETTPTSSALRSSPSVAHLLASRSRRKPARLS